MKKSLSFFSFFCLIIVCIFTVNASPEENNSIMDELREQFNRDQQERMGRTFENKECEEEECKKRPEGERCKEGEEGECQKGKGKFSDKKHHFKKKCEEINEQENAEEECEKAKICTFTEDKCLLNEEKIKEFFKGKEGEGEKCEEGEEGECRKGKGDNKKRPFFKKNHWKNFSADEIKDKMKEEGFVNSFDPSEMRNFEQEVIENVGTDVLNTLLKENPKKLKRLDPKILKNLSAEQIEALDPEIFNHIKHFGKHFDAKMFNKIQDDKFFEKMNPNFLNHTNVEDIPEEMLDKMDFSKLKNINPKLLEKIEKNSPEQAKKIPKAIKRAAKLMMEEIPEDLLKDFGFEGEEAEKVQQLMQTVNKRKRKKIIPILQEFDNDVQKDVMDLQDDFADEVGDFIEYLPNVPKKKRQEFLEHKQDFLKKVKKLKEKIKKLEGKLTVSLKKDLQALEKSIVNYNFMGKKAKVLRQSFHEFIESLETLSIEQIQNKVVALKAKIEESKNSSKEEKFNQGIIPFKDTDDNDWYTESINDIPETVIGGYKDANGKPLGEFRPGKKVTVAEAIKMAVANAENEESTGIPNNLKARDHWVKGWVTTGEDLGLTIAEEQEVNVLAERGQVIRWVIESFGIVPPVATSSSFPDVSLDHADIDYVEYAKEIGMISGDGDTGKARLADPIIRAEVAKILQKAREFLLESEEEEDNSLFEYEDEVETVTEEEVENEAEEGDSSENSDDNSGEEDSEGSSEEDSSENSDNNSGEEDSEGNSEGDSD